MFASKKCPQVRVVPLQDAAQLFAVPGEDPHVEDRVAQVPRDVARETRCERPGHTPPRSVRMQPSHTRRAAPRAMSFSGVGQSFLEEHLKDRGRRHGENRAHDAEERSADQQRDDDEHRADADLPLHDLRHEQVVFKLLLREEEDE